MKIICNGGYRTGSTLVYNLAAEILGPVKMSGPHSSMDQTFEAIRTKETEVIKTHIWQPTGSEPKHVKVLYTYRDLRDMAVSFLYLAERKIPEEHILIESRRQNMISKYMKYLQSAQWANDALLIRYENYYGDNPRLVRDIAKFLEIDLDDKKVEEIAVKWCISKIREKSLKIEKMSFDTKTQLRHGHVTAHAGKPGSWASYLPSELLNKILEIGDKNETGLYLY